MSDQTEQQEAIEVLQIQLDFLKGVQEKNIVLAAKLREAEKRWIDPTDKTQSKYLPHIGEKVLFCFGGKTYYGRHTGGSFQSFCPQKHFETWLCKWMYPPIASVKGN